MISIENLMGIVLTEAIEKDYKDCDCTLGCEFCIGWPITTLEVRRTNRTTPNGRKIHNIEETKNMDFPYPPESDL